MCATIADYLKMPLLTNAERKDKIYFRRAARHSPSVGHFTGVKMEAGGPVHLRPSIARVTIYIKKFPDSE